MKESLKQILAKHVEIQKIVSELAEDDKQEYLKYALSLNLYDRQGTGRSRQEGTNNREEI